MGKYNIVYDRKSDASDFTSIANGHSIEAAIVLAVANGDYDRADEIMDQHAIGPATKKVCDDSGWRAEDTLFASIVGNNARDYSGELAFAVYQYLLQRDPEFLFSPSPDDPLKTALHRCFEGKFTEKIFDDLLIKARDPANTARGLHVNAKDTAGNTPIFHASTPYAIHALNKAGADRQARNNLDQTALIYHAMERNFSNKIQEALLEAGYEVNAQDKSGKTALHYIMQQANPIELALKIENFLAKGADPSIEDKNQVRPFCRDNLEGIRSAYSSVLQRYEEELQRSVEDYSTRTEMFSQVTITDDERRIMERAAERSAPLLNMIDLMRTANQIAVDDEPKMQILFTYGHRHLYTILRDGKKTESEQFERMVPALEQMDRGGVAAAESWVLQHYRARSGDAQLGAGGRG